MVNGARCQGLLFKAFDSKKNRLYPTYFSRCFVSQQNYKTRAEGKGGDKFSSLLSQGKSIKDRGHLMKGYPRFTADPKGTLMSVVINNEREKDKASMIERWVSNDNKGTTFGCSSQAGVLTRLLTGFKDRLQIYAQLSKLKLSALVVSTTVFGYGMAPTDITFDMNTLGHFSATIIGTALCVCSANSLNQFLEIPYDCQMKRTFNRVLPRHAISMFHAFVFGISCGLLGFGILYYKVNECSGILGIFNIVLYAGVYTPLKRITIWNTWVGAVVGAIPPLIGYSACTGSIDFRSLILAGVLFCWQFPHFNALSHRIKTQYARAGYRMMSVVKPSMNSLTSLTYSIWLLPLTCLAAAPGIKLTSLWFLLDANALNLVLIVKAFGFYEKKCLNSARNLFLFSLIHLPVYMLLMILHKRPSQSMSMYE